MQYLTYPPLYVCASNGLQPIRIEVHEPLRTLHGDFGCTVEIVGLSVDCKKVLFGQDAIQALGIGLNFIKELIINSEEFKANLIEDEIGSKEITLISTSLDSYSPPS